MTLFPIPTSVTVTEVLCIIPIREMGCWYSKCRGPKKAAAKKEAKEAVEIKAVNTLPSGGEDAAAADDAEDLSNRTSITNENAILPNDGELRDKIRVPQLVLLFEFVLPI